VEEGEWRSACLVAGLAVPNDLVAALVARRLARVRDGGWTFEHAMLRESLERSARESGRIRGWHHAVAAALQIRWSVGREPGLAERLARHLVDAGRKAEADLPLAVAAGEHRAMSDYVGTLDLIDVRESLLSELAVEADDPRWGECSSLRAELLIGQGRLEEAEQVALGLADRARAFGWPNLVAPALRHAATVALKRGRLEQAEERLRAAEGAARDVDEVEVARCLVFLCDVVRLQGRVDEALRFGRRALARFDALDDPRGQADALAALAGVSRSIGDADRTEAYCRGAIPLYERVGSRFGVAVARNTLAEVLRKRGDLAGAEEAYRVAELLLRQLGSPEHLVPRLNLGLVLRERGDLQGSRVVLEEALLGMERGGRKGWAGLVHALLLPVVAALSDRAAWVRHRAGALDLLRASKIVDADVAESLELAVDLAASAGNLGGIESIADLASAQWTALGQPDRALRVREGLARNRVTNPGDD
jgi:tetratricopeptide (TPR) repeat protein